MCESVHKSHIEVTGTATHTVIPGMHAVIQPASHTKYKIHTHARNHKHTRRPHGRCISGHMQQASDAGIRVEETFVHNCVFSYVTGVQMPFGVCTNTHASTLARSVLCFVLHPNETPAVNEEHTERGPAVFCLHDASQTKREHTREMRDGTTTPQTTHRRLRALSLSVRFGFTLSTGGQQRRRAASERRRSDSNTRAHTAHTHILDILASRLPCVWSAHSFGFGIESLAAD